MTAEAWASVDDGAQTATRADGRWLRGVIIAAGLCWAILFVVIGVGFQLQLYGDGSIFSYSVAVEDAWAFHWHNISGRLFTYLSTLLPAEIYVALTRDAYGGITIYGVLFFAAPLLGVLATFATDRSKDRIIFGYACFSTACLCPLVFGFPTEMWMAHALFWPTLALCHYTRGGVAGVALVLPMLLALVLTHEGALVLAAIIVATLLLRGWRDRAFQRAAVGLLVAISIWALVKLAIRPDDYFAGMFIRAALGFFDLAIFESNLVLLLLGTLAAYGFLLLVCSRLKLHYACFCASAIVALALAIYWIWFDQSLHADHRYFLRTAMVIATPVLGVLAAVHALHADGRLKLPLLPRLAPAFGGPTAIRAAIGAIVLVTLVHTVETAKFVMAWSDYKVAVRALATGAASDPALGDARFVSADRIGASLNRLSWNSTTLFLSALLAPGLAPERLVIDPSGNYFWLTCETATANEEADRAVPVGTRRLLRVHACLHR